MRYFLHISPLLLILTACQNGSSSTSGYRTELSHVQLGQTISKNPASIEYKGETYSSGVKIDGTKDVIFEVQSTDDEINHYLIVDGEFVNFIALDHYNTYDSSDRFQAYGMDGERKFGLSSGVYEYEGEYMIMSASNPFIAGYNDEVKLKVDFEQGIIKGSSRKGDDTVIRGVIDGTNTELMISDITGFHAADGYFFGAKAEEFMGFYQESEQSGVIYASQP